MTLSLETKVHKPPRILLYGPQKIGKSTFGSMAEAPVFIQTEDGLDGIDVPRFPLASSFQQVMGYITELATARHDRKTLVVDSVDWLEPLIWKQVAEENGKPNIEAIGYGKGYTMALDLWREYISALNYLRDAIGMTIVQIAHAEIKRFDSPDTDSYDRYHIKLHKGASSLLAEHSEIILFANYYVGIKKEDAGFNKKKAKAIGGEERILYTEERPAFIAGNRYGLPSEIPFDRNGACWGVIASHVPFWSSANTTATAAEQAA